jgi:SAM-dependent methyltransferase
MNIQDFEDQIARKEYKFLDFGCSYGSGMDHTYKIFDGARPGLGLDISEDKIEQARENGHDAMVFDILQIPDRKIVEFVTMTHFLEHLPSVKAADQFLRKAVAVARQFVLVKQPFFDADGYLAHRGLKLFWSDWTGHPNKMTSLDFYLSLNRMKRQELIRGFSIHFVDKIVSSNHPTIHPLDSPVNQQVYDSTVHPIKERGISLDHVFKEIFVLIHIDKVNPLRFGKMDLSNSVLSIEK